MIAVTLYSEAGRITGCRASGHSGYADSGHDIVCAGVSILTVTCVNALESVCGVTAEIEAYDEETGLLAFRLPKGLTGAQEAGARVLTGALRQGLEDLAREYPQNVKVSTKERRETTC